MAGRKPLPGDQRKVERRIYRPAPIWSRVDQLAKLFGAPSADVAGLLMEDGLRRAERREARKNAHKNRITPHNSGVDG